MIAEQDLTRRSFLQVMGGVGASLVLGGFTMSACSSTAAAAASAVKKNGVTFIPNVFLKIDPDGFVTVTVHRSEMGQGVRTSFAMTVAEELDADWQKVKVVQADGDRDKYGPMGTGGSSSTTSTYDDLRKMGAAGRAMLIAAAAKQWGVDPSTCTTKQGNVLHQASGRSIGYGELTAVAAGLPVPQDAPLKSPKDFQILGKPALRIDNPDIVTGRAVYGLDAKVEGLKYGVIARPPSFGGYADSYDEAAAKKVPGVRDVFKVTSGIAVIADNTWAAIQGRNALKPKWNAGPNADVTTSKLRQAMIDATGEHGQMPDGAKVVDASYDLPYVAHATLEPMNATADVKEGSCTVWVPTQASDSVRYGVASALGTHAENVKVNVTLLGGGFGRRSYFDFVLDAVEASKHSGFPVKLMWTREDDMKHDHYRPMSRHTLRGAVDAGGKAVGWSHQMVQANGRGNDGRADIPYEIPDASMSRKSIPSPVPNGAWRSVEHSQVIFANECFIDELALAAGKDPYEFRKSLIKDQRLLKVLDTVAQRSGWGTPLPAGSGRGIALFSGYSSYIAHVAEVSVQGDKIKLHKVTVAVDVGLPLNPKGVESQVQSGCSDGISLALHAEITIDKGGVVQNSWDDYPWTTMDEMPQMDITILRGSDTPGGMGELGVPSTAPAIANAVFAATGKRVRKLPIKISELV